MVLYRSPECIAYAKLEQAWKYTEIHDYMLYKLSPKFDHVIKMVKVNPVSSLEQIW